MSATNDDAATISVALRLDCRRGISRALPASVGHRRRWRGGGGERSGSLGVRRETALRCVAAQRRRRHLLGQ